MFKLMERVKIVKHKRLLPVAVKDKAAIVKAHFHRKQGEVRMKSTLSQPVSPCYPKLMFSSKSGCVYLVTDKASGVCVHSTGHSLGREVGEKLLYTNNLRDFSGSITLSNNQEQYHEIRKIHSGKHR